MSDIAELFARNPLELTKDDVTKIVEEMRKSRHAFNAGNMKAGSTKAPTTKQKELTSLSDKLGLNIDI